MKRLSASILMAITAIASLPVPAQTNIDLLINARPAANTNASDDVKGVVGLPSSSTLQASQNELMTLGNVWSVNECCGWTGTWTRRPGTNQFGATWRHTNGTVVNDTITLAGWNKGNYQVVLTRQGNNGTYRATYNPAARSMTAGTASWYPAGASWSATLR
jgi:hypothetical protein